MKNLLVIVGIILSVSAGFAQPNSETRQVGSFDGIKSAEAIDVYLKKGDKEAVKVEVSGDGLADVITEISGTYLKIHMKDGNYFRSKPKNVKVYVTYVSLEKISASSASNVFSEGIIKSSSIDIRTSSAASVEVSVEAESLTVDASSAGNVVLEGKAKKTSIEASSAGDIDAYGLESESVNASTSSAGSIKLAVTKELDARASSGGSIRYRGNPSKTNTDSSSGGSVKKSN